MLLPSAQCWMQMTQKLQLQALLLALLKAAVCLQQQLYLWWIS